MASVFGPVLPVEHRCARYHDCEHCEYEELGEVEELLPSSCVSVLDGRAHALRFLAPERPLIVVVREGPVRVEFGGYLRADSPVEVDGAGRVDSGCHGHGHLVALHPRACQQRHEGAVLRPELPVLVRLLPVGRPVHPVLVLDLAVRTDELLELAERLGGLLVGDGACERLRVCLYLGDGGSALEFGAHLLGVEGVLGRYVEEGYDRDQHQDGCHEDLRDAPWSTVSGSRAARSPDGP